MEGFPNEIKDQADNSAQLSPIQIECTLWPDSPPKPIAIPMCVPEILNQARQTPTKSPILSPFARYSRKQNDSLLSVVTLSKSETHSSPSKLQGWSSSEEIDQFGFYIKSSKELHNLQNNTVPIRSFQTETDAMNEWSAIMNNKLKRKDIPKALIKRGIPHPFRKLIWKYLACLHEEEKASELEKPKKSECVESNDEMVESLDKSENTNSQNGTSLLANNDNKNVKTEISDENTYEKLMGSSDPNSDATKEYIQLVNLPSDDSASIAQIYLDIHRTFPTHVLFKEKDSITQQKLTKVLLAYSNYNQRIGYCQGMSYVAGLFLMYYDEAESFWLLEFLLQKNRLGENYIKSMSGILRMSTILDELLKSHYPLIFQHFKGLGIHPLMYVTSWFMTLFTQLNSWQCVLKFFDLFFYFGTTALYRFALGLLHICQEDLLKFEKLEHLLPYLQSIPVERCDDPLLFPLCCSFPIDMYLMDVQRKLEALERAKTYKSNSTTGSNTLSSTRAHPINHPHSKRSSMSRSNTPSSSSFFDKVFSSFSSTPKSQRVTNDIHSPSVNTPKSRKVDPSLMKNHDNQENQNSNCKTTTPRTSGRGNTQPTL